MHSWADLEQLLKLLHLLGAILGALRDDLVGLNAVVLAVLALICSIGHLIKAIRPQRRRRQAKRRRRRKR